MRNFKFSLPLAALFVIGMVFTACQKDNVLTEASKQNRFYSHDCDEVCIDEDSGNEYSHTFSGKMVQGNDEYDFNIEVYNTLTHMVYVFSTSNSTIFCIKLNDVNGATIYSGPPTTSWTYQVPLTQGKCSNIAQAFWINRNNCSGTGGGVAVIINTEYHVVGPCCTESFSYTGSGTEYTFTYVSEVAILGAEVKFTCPHITGFSACDSKTYTVNPGNSQGSPTVLTWVGDIAACEEITFCLDFVPDCAQNNAGFANLWTDFKVNEFSKKGDNDTIRYNCD